MVQGRIEVTPEEQLQGLRDARDRYLALADRLHDSAEPEADPQKKLELERDARRIANAYEKSLANSMARTAGMRQARLFALPALSAGMWLTIFVVISAAEGTALLAIFRPAIFQIKSAGPQSVGGKVIPAAPMAKDKMQRVAAAATDAGMAPSAIAAPKARPSENQHPDLRTAPPVITVPKPNALPQSPPRTMTVQQVPRLLDLAKPPMVAMAPKSSVQQPAPIPVTAARQVPPPLDPAKPLLAAIAPKSEAQQDAPPPIAAARPVPPPPDPVKAVTVAAPDASAPQPAPPSTTAFILVPPPKPAAPVPSPTRLEPVAYTHLSPPYPTLSKRLGEQGTTQMQVAISTQGAVTDCKIIKTSGSVRLDTTACTFVQGHWRWQPPTRDGKPITATENVSVIWNLEGAP